MNLAVIFAASFRLYICNFTPKQLVTYFLGSYFHKKATLCKISAVI